MLAIVAISICRGNSPQGEAVVWLLDNVGPLIDWMFTSLRVAMGG